MKPIRLMGSWEIQRMREAGAAAAELLRILGEMVEPGISTQQLDDAAAAWATKHGYRNGPLGYSGRSETPFPRSICTSINSAVCHQIPSAADILQGGDIVNIDVTPVVAGYYGDTSKTFAVGNVSSEAARLIRVTEECLELGMSTVRNGSHLGDIGAAISAHAMANGLGLVRDFTGHGIGREFHGAPTVLHFGVAGTGLKLETGMVFTIEPMLVTGSTRTVMSADGWTVRTVDGGLSAQAEHTVVVQDDGCEVLTRHQLY